MYKDLPLSDRARIIGLAVKSGITDLSTIEEVYNRFDEGGPKSDNYKKIIEDRFPIMQTYKYNVYPDRAVSNGYGDIETFAGNWAKDTVHYSNGFNLDNKYPGETSIVFNPDKITEEDIVLDALHIAREQDPVYQTLLNAYEKEALKTDFEDFYGDGNEENFHNGVDGVLRGSMYRGDRVKARYAPAEEYEELYRRYPQLGEAYKNLKQYLESGYITPATVVANEYKNGGQIHIKKENRGKFTALKERTGHSASWFKEHGTPAQKKMAVFALNARKWKHEDGGLMTKI